MKQGKEHNSEEDFGRHSVQDLNRRRARDSPDRGGQAPGEIVHPQRNLPPTSKDYQYHCPHPRKMYNISMPRTRRASRNGHCKESFLSADSEGMPNRFWKVSLLRALICYSYSTYTCYVRLITLCAFAEGDLSLRFLASET